MTLEERVLEVLTERPLRRPAIFGCLIDDSRAAVDQALVGLVKRRKIEMVDGFYRRAPEPPSSTTVSIAVASRNGPPRKPDGKVAARRSVDMLTPRQREIFDLFESGLANAEIAARLNLSIGCVKSQLSNARQRLGQSPKSAPSVVVPTSAAPSPEDADPATVGAAQPSNELPKGEVRAPATVVPLKPVRRITVSPGVRARLIEQQREKAEAVQMYCNLLAEARQELADIEEIVRIVSAEGMG